MHRYLRLSLWFLTICVISLFSACKKDSWCVGNWDGELNNRMHTKYNIQFRRDGSCHVKKVWYWGGTRSADFEAEWEPISDDVIKIYDYVGHRETWDWEPQDGCWVTRWIMHLRKDGAMHQESSQLDNPYGYLKKR